MKSVEKQKHDSSHHIQPTVLYVHTNDWKDRKFIKQVCITRDVKIPPKMKFFFYLGGQGGI